MSNLNLFFPNSSTSGCISAMFFSYSQGFQTVSGMGIKKGKTYHTAVVVIPPEELWAPIQAIRRLHDCHYRRWMPHITLLYPFRPIEEFTHLREQFQEVLSDFPAFALRLSSFKEFHHGRGSFTLWLAPEPVEPLLNLLKQLEKIVPDCTDTRNFPGGFTPHLSLGQFRGKEHLLSKKQQFKKSWKPIAFVVKEICLIWRNDPPDDVFRIGEKVFLKSEMRI